jgi:hypothetical protein
MLLVYTTLTKSWKIKYKDFSYVLTLSHDINVECNLQI